MGEATLTPEDLELADALARELAMLIRLVQRSARYPGAAGMDRAGFQVLVRLASQGPQRAVDVAEAVCADPSTVSRRVAALVKDGLLERRADPQDGRASLLAVTEQGLAALEHSRRYRAEVISATIADWPREQRRQLVELLGRFTADFQRHDVPAVLASRPGGGI
ncbi:MarR family winged helix-turn-helix transcriptional regulator [Pseudonocardia hispaniensis]|uniref:MarR family winged helix-turn-helix transcriptional regulator n=1 Tax=Pseudonocardia hispaniensis TaxID=904933 RepID=UPI0036D2E0D1